MRTSKSDVYRRPTTPTPTRRAKRAASRHMDALTPRPGKSAAPRYSNVPPASRVAATKDTAESEWTILVLVLFLVLGLGAIVGLTYIVLLG